MPQSFTRTAFAVAVLTASIAIHLGLLGVIVLAERRGLAKSETETIEVELLKPEELQEEQKKEKPKPDPLRFEFPKFDVSKQQQQQRQQQQSASQSASQAAQSKPEPKGAQKSASAETNPQMQEPPPPGEPPPGDSQEKPDIPSGGAPSETKAKLTPDEIAAFRAEIQKCWELMVGVPDAMKLEVVLRVGLTRKGTLVAAPELLKAPAHTSGPRLVGIAMKAMAGCGPYKSLPTAKYNEWKVLDLRFLATGLAGLDTNKVDLSKIPRG